MESTFWVVAETVCYKRWYISFCHFGKTIRVSSIREFLYPSVRIVFDAGQGQPIVIKPYPTGVKHESTTTYCIRLFSKDRMRQIVCLCVNIGAPLQSNARNSAIAVGVFRNVHFWVMHFGVHCTSSNASALIMWHRRARCRYKKQCVNTLHHAGNVSAAQSGLVLSSNDMRDDDHTECSGGTSFRLSY